MLLTTACRVAYPCFVVQEHQTLSVLAASGSAPSIATQMFGSGLIGLREGLETGIVVMILVAFLVKAQRRDALKWVWMGVGIAVAMVAVIFFVIALIAAVFGFGGIAGAATEIARILFVVFIVLFLVSLVFGRGRGGDAI